MPSEIFFLWSPVLLEFSYCWPFWVNITMYTMCSFTVKFLVFLFHEIVMALLFYYFFSFCYFSFLFFYILIYLPIFIAIKIAILVFKNIFSLSFSYFKFYSSPEVLAVILSSIFFLTYPSFLKQYFLIFQVSCSNYLVSDLFQFWLL